MVVFFTTYREIEMDDFDYVNSQKDTIKRLSALIYVLYTRLA